MRSEVDPTHAVDVHFMREALFEAQKAFDLNEVPIGAVLVYKGEVIARGFNQVETLGDATAHAEMMCIKGAYGFFHNWRLLGATLYCTLEPCAMCFGAMILSRVDALVWGAPDLRHGVHGSWVDLLEKKHPIHQVRVRQGVLKEEASELMRNFFAIRRKEKETKKYDLETF